MNVNNVKCGINKNAGFKIIQFARMPLLIKDKPRPLLIKDKFDVENKITFSSVFYKVNPHAFSVEHTKSKVIDVKIPKYKDQKNLDKKQQMATQEQIDKAKAVVRECLKNLKNNKQIFNSIINNIPDKSYANWEMLKKFINKLGCKKNVKNEVIKQLISIYEPNKVKLNKKKEEDVFNFSDYILKSNWKEDISLISDPNCMDVGSTKTQMEYYDKVISSIENKEVKSDVNKILIKNKEYLRKKLVKLYEQGLKTKHYSYYSVDLNKEILENFYNIAFKNSKINPVNAYKEAVVQYQDNNMYNWGITNFKRKDEDGKEYQVMIIPKTYSDENFYKERYQFIQTHSCETWCVYQDEAPYYLEYGDFFIFKPSSKTSLIDNYQNIGLNLDDNGKISQMQDQTNDDVTFKNVEKFEKIIRLCNLTSNLNDEFGKNIENIKKQMNNTINLFKNRFNEEVNIEDFININNIPLKKLDLKNDNDLIEFNEKYFKRLIQDIEKFDNKIPFKVINTKNLENLNKTFKNNKLYNQQLYELNNSVLTRFIAQFELEDCENLNKVINIEDIENLNKIFKNNKLYIQQLNKFNDAFIHYNIKKLDTCSNIDKDKIEFLKDFNEIYKDNEGYNEKLFVYNKAFINSCIKKLKKEDNKTDNIDFAILNEINSIFKNDKLYNELLNELNNAYWDNNINKLIKNENDVSFDNFYKINDKFEGNKAFNEKLYIYNKAFLNLCIKNIEKDSESLSNFKLNDMIQFNVKFKYDEKYSQDMSVFNKASLIYFTKKLKEDKINDIDLNDVISLNTIFEYEEDEKELNEQLNEFNNTLLEYCIKKIQNGRNNINVYDFNAINNYFKNKDIYSENLYGLNNVYLDYYINKLENKNYFVYDMELNYINKTLEDNEIYNEKLKRLNTLFHKR